MGRPKALLDFDGRTCLDLVLTACRDACLGRPLVVTARALRVQVSGAAPDAIVVVNENPERGQLSSLKAGLSRLAPDATDAAAFLVFPVDYPLVRGEDIRPLVAAFATRSPGHPGQRTQRIFIPAFGGRRGHPLLVDAALAPDFLALPEDGSARDVLRARAWETVHVEAASDRVLADMDTPLDYENCLRRFRLGH